MSWIQEIIDALGAAGGILSAPSDPSDDGAIATASGGNLVYRRYIGLGSDPASTGDLRVSAGFSANAKIAGVARAMIAVGAGFVFGDANVTAGMVGSTVGLTAGGSLALQADGAAVDFQDRDLITTGYASIGATPAGAGDVRLPSAFAVKARNNSNTLDLAVLGTDSSDRVFLGGTNVVAVDLYGGGSLGLRLDATTADFQDRDITTLGDISAGNYPPVSGDIPWDGPGPSTTVTEEITRGNWTFDSGYYQVVVPDDTPIVIGELDFTALDGASGEYGATGHQATGRVILEIIDNKYDSGGGIGRAEYYEITRRMWRDNGGDVTFDGLPVVSPISNGNSIVSFNDGAPAQLELTKSSSYYSVIQARLYGPLHDTTF